MRREELEAVLELATEIPLADLPALLGQLEEIRLVGMQRMLTKPLPDDTRLLTVREAAERLRVSTAYLYANSETLPFARHIGSRLLFSSSGLNDYLLEKKEKQK